MSDPADIINNAMASENGYQAYSKVKENLVQLIETAKKNGMSYFEACNVYDCIDELMDDHDV